jgi:hypothetical protein
MAAQRAANDPHQASRGEIRTMLGGAACSSSRLAADWRRRRLRFDCIHCLPYAILASVSSGLLHVTCCCAGHASGILLVYMELTGKLPIRAAEAALPLKQTVGILTRASPPPGYIVLGDSVLPVAPNRCRQIVAVVFIKFVFTGCTPQHNCCAGVWAPVARNGGSSNVGNTASRLYRKFPGQGLDLVISHFFVRDR